MNQKKIIDTRLVISGRVSREYIITPSGVAKNGVLGGSALYAAAGAKLWMDGVAILAKVGENFLTESFSVLNELGVNTSGIVVADHYIEDKSFIGYDSSLSISRQNPATFYLQSKQKFPKELLSISQNKNSDPQQSTSKIEDQIRLSEIPREYLLTKAIYLSRTNHEQQMQISSYFVQNDTNILTIRLNDVELDPQNQENLRQLMNHQTILFTSTTQLRRLWWSTHLDHWQLAKNFCDLGCEVVIIESREKGYLVLEKSTWQKWVIPRYSNEMVDPTGTNATFDGGATAGYYLTMDPVDATLHGEISRSICGDGTGAKFMLESHPELAISRLRSLRNKIKKFED